MDKVSPCAMVVVAFQLNIMFVIPQRRRARKMPGSLAAVACAVRRGQHGLAAASNQSVRQFGQAAIRAAVQPCASHRPGHERSTYYYIFCRPSRAWLASTRYSIPALDNV